MHSENGVGPVRGDGLLFCNCFIINMKGWTWCVAVGGRRPCEEFANPWTVQARFLNCNFRIIRSSKERNHTQNIQM